MFLLLLFLICFFSSIDKHSFIKQNIRAFMSMSLASVKTSPQWRSKVLCVLKKGVKRITRDRFRHQLRLGEVPCYPMEHLPVVISEVSELICGWTPSYTYVAMLFFWFFLNSLHVRDHRCCCMSSQMG